MNDIPHINTTPNRMKLTVEDLLSRIKDNDVSSIAISAVTKDGEIITGFVGEDYLKIALDGLKCMKINAQAVINVIKGKLK